MRKADPGPITTAWLETQIDLYKDGKKLNKHEKQRIQKYLYQKERMAKLSHDEKWTTQYAKGRILAKKMLEKEEVDPK